jgi:23S rRNA (cytosine1962-C5)-methyltransferase
MKTGIILQKGKEKFLKQKHLWVFSGAIYSYPDNFENGNIYPVYSHGNELLGYGYFNQNCSLSGRMISFDNKDFEKTIFNNLQKAINYRNIFFDKKITNAYRLVYGEADNLPGLIVDYYNNFLVIQIGTLGMEKLKPQIISYLNTTLKPIGIYEKSNLPTRKEEGLQNFEGLLSGEMCDEITILENSIPFLISFKKSQKTGFFLDQREMRLLVKHYASNRKVLNCFGYTGAFSVYALKGNAILADTLEISEDALNMAKKNFNLNNLSAKENQFIQEDVFNFFKKKSTDYDFIILDPPAFAKKKKDIIQASRGYKEINRLALEWLPSKSLLLTCSCSYHVDEKLFTQIIFAAALEAKRNVKIISKHHLAIDHPINIYHPEGNYLKSFLLYVE